MLGAMVMLALGHVLAAILAAVLLHRFVLLLLFVLHQDFWWKNDPTLVFGFLPISLAYHVVWTLLVALGWFLVGKFCWPEGLDEEPKCMGVPAMIRSRKRPSSHRDERSGD